MNEKKNELIAKLKKIRELYRNYCVIDNKIGDVEPEDNYPRKIKVPPHPAKDWICWLEKRFDPEKENAIEIIEEEYIRKAAPLAPSKPNYGEPPKPPKPLKASDLLIGYDGGRLLNICYLIGAFLLFISLIATVTEPINFKYYWFFILVSLLLIAPRIIKAIKHNLYEQEAYKAGIEAYDRQIAEKEKLYAEAVKKYEEEKAEFEINKAEFIKKYTEWREIYLASVQEEKEIQSQLEKERKQLQDKIRNEELAPAKKEFEDFNDLVSDNYLLCTSKIIDILEEGRADDYKEALNVLEDDYYKAEQLRLQREQEESRKKEAQRQLELEEERLYAEKRQHKEQMELIKSQEERRVRDEEDRRRKESKAIEDRCWNCMHYKDCYLRKFGDASACTGFTPGR